MDPDRMKDKIDLGEVWAQKVVITYFIESQTMESIVDLGGF